MRDLAGAANERERRTTAAVERTIKVSPFGLNRLPYVVQTGVSCLCPLLHVFQHVCSFGTFTSFHDQRHTYTRARRLSVELPESINTF